MSEKKEQNTSDAMSGEKIREIIGKIKNAQERGDSPKEVLDMVSGQLEKEPFLTIPFIDSLAGVPSTETALLLEEMLSRAEEKTVKKNIKRTLYRLSQKGVAWEQSHKEESPAYAPPKPEQPEGYLGSMDYTGSRFILVSKPGRSGGMLIAFSIVNDKEGFKDLDMKEFTRKGFRDFVKENLSSTVFPIVTCPGAYCILLLRDASTLTKNLSLSLPKGYYDLENEFRTITWEGANPIIYDYIKREEVEGRPDLLKESAGLHEIPPFSGWYLNAEVLDKYALDIKEAWSGKIVVSPEQKESRINDIYLRALDDLFSADERLFWKRRMEEEAYILIKREKQSEARATLSAAVNLENPVSHIEPNPFMWELLVKSMEILIEEGSKDGETKEPSLIVTP